MRVLVAIACITVVVVLSGGIFASISDPHKFTGIFDGIWWSATTVTTVGYGDIVPTSTLGRLAGIVLMFTGIGLLAMLTATVAALLMSEDVELEELHIEQRLEILEQKLDEIRTLITPKQ